MSAKLLLLLLLIPEGKRVGGVGTTSTFIEHLLCVLL